MSKRLSVSMPLTLSEVLEQGASENGRSVSREIVARLQSTIVKPLVLGWVKLDRWGEIDDRDEPEDALAVCESCGQDVDANEAFIGLLSNGQNHGPVCVACVCGLCDKRITNRPTGHIPQCGEGMIMAYTKTLSADLYTLDALQVLRGNLNLFQIQNTWAISGSWKGRDKMLGEEEVAGFDDNGLPVKMIDDEEVALSPTSQSVIQFTIG